MVQDLQAMRGQVRDGALTADERARFGIPSCVRLEISIHDKFHLRRVAAELMSLATDLDQLGRNPEYDALNCAVRADALISAAKLKCRIPTRISMQEGE